MITFISFSLDLCFGWSDGSKIFDMINAHLVFFTSQKTPEGVCAVFLWTVHKMLH